ncbi:hypothetical protein EDC01DRAFT_672502 [Geopyxis carbonaria]|nr:hypothetical protein EDC01DRAFT_672502 [Geopyxis carbonaria]
MLPTLNTSCSPAHKPVFQPYNPGSTLTRNSYLHKRAARSRASLPAGSKYQAYQPPALFTPARPVTAATTSPSPTTSEESADADLMWREVAGAVGLAMTPVEQSVQRGTPVRVGTTKVPPMQVASLVTATPEPPPSPDLLATPADGSTLAVPQTPALARMVRRTLTFQYEEVENAVEDEYTDEFEEVVNCEELAAEYQSLIGGGW